MKPKKKLKKTLWMYLFHEKKSENYFLKKEYYHQMSYYQLR